MSETRKELEANVNELRTKLDAARQLLGQYVSDLAYFAKAHASEYAIRRQKEVRKSADEI